MPNTAILAIYIPLTVITAAVILFAVIRDRKKRLTKYFLLPAVGQFFWLFVNVLLYSIDHRTAALYLFDLDLPFLALTTFGILLISLRFYRMEIFASRAAFVILCVPTVTTLLLACLPTQTTLLRELEILQAAPQLLYAQRRGPWFWIHAAYCYGMMAAALVITLLQHSRLPRSYRAPSFCLMIGILITALGNLIVVSDIYDDIDFSMVFATVSVIFLYIAMRNNQGVDFLTRTRANVFQSIDDAMLVLDMNNRVIGANSAAGACLARIGFTGQITDYKAVTSYLSQKASHTGEWTEDDGSRDYHLESDGATFVLNVLEKPILRKKRRQIGTLVVMNDVTDNRALIERLENEAGIDALTGIANRRRIEEFMEEFDELAHWPLAVIMCDVNNLKVVNDTQGHNQGDVLLRVAAEVLSARCPSYTRVGRLGGDEFIILLPGTELAAAEDLIKEIHAAAGEVTDYPFTLSIAMGAAVKEEAGQDLRAVMRLADKRMYTNKSATRLPQKDDPRGRLVIVKSG